MEPYGGDILNKKYCLHFFKVIVLILIVSETDLIPDRTDQQYGTRWN